MPAVSRLVGAGIAAVSLHCVDRLELPEPPATAHLEEAYENPSLELTPGTAEAVILGFLDLRERLADLDDLGPLVRALVRFDQTVSTADEDGDSVLELAGVPLRADAVITLLADCPGFAGEPAMDAIDLIAVVRDSELVPVVWGTIDDCRLERQRAGVTAQVRFSGGVTNYLPTILDRDARPRIFYVELDLDQLEIAGQQRPPWSGDFRLVDDRLEARVAVDDVGSLVVYATRRLAVVGVRAANGDWECDTQERLCERVESSADPFSY